MSLQRARAHLEKFGFTHKIREFEESSATVNLAAKALGTEEARIAKTLSFKVFDRVVLIVCAGDVKVQNGKFKSVFNTKANMLSKDMVEELIGHDVGGVCPFGVKDGVEVYLDDSLKRFDSVFPACGNDKSAVHLTIDELEKCSGSIKWVDVCKYID